jgi:hypothetical protein
MASILNWMMVQVPMQGKGMVNAAKQLKETHGTRPYLRYE